MSAAPAFTPFETPLGICALVWSEAGIVGANLPETDRAALTMRLQRRFPNAEETAPPDHIRQICGRISGLLHGSKDDLGDISLVMTGIPDFAQAVYAATRQIGPGSVATYGDIARSIGAPDKARAVGWALGQNPFAPIVPCHRVLAADGRLHGFSASGGLALKRTLLRIEKAPGFDLPDLFDGM